MAEVRFSGEVRKAAGVASFGIDAGTVEELLEQLRRVMRPRFQELLFEGEKVRQEVGILVNGVDISSLAGLKTALTPFDQVTLSITGERGSPGG